ncbi:MAG: hypothetical protein NTY38_16980 [Acidobacteria bacterium]|nr:hypothetical protein [Acidobacteriota bacterium]
MSSTGKRIRLNRIFGTPGSRALIVAYDHALMLGPIEGTEAPAAKIARFVEAGVDGILMSLGTLRGCVDSLMVPDPPAVIARLDWTNVWYRPGAAQSGEYRSCLVAGIEDALRYGADAVVTYMFLGSGDPAVDAAEIAKNAQVAQECDRLGLPHIIESMARGKDVPDPCDPGWIRRHTRMASELGADLIKTDYTGDPQSMRGVVERCPTPILLAGGPRQASDDGGLSLVRGAAEAGAAGVIFGRNVFQADDMKLFLEQARALLLRNVA